MKILRFYCPDCHTELKDRGGKPFHTANAEGFVVRPLDPSEDWTDADLNRGYCERCKKWFKLVKDSTRPLPP